MKTLRTIIILLPVFMLISCDIIIDSLFEDCERYNNGWVRFENTSSNYIYEIYMDYAFKCRLNPYETSEYYSISIGGSHNVEWKCVECNGHVSECVDASWVFVTKCERETLKCSD